MTKPREKTREELTAEIEDGKKKIRQFENREKVLRQKLSIVNNSTHFDISKSTLALCCVLSAAQGFFPFLAILSNTFDALYAGRTFVLRGIGR